MMGFEPTTFCMASGSWVQAGERREAQQRTESDLRLASGDLLTHLPSRLFREPGDHFLANLLRQLRSATGNQRETAGAPVALKWGGRT